MKCNKITKIFPALCWLKNYNKKTMYEDFVAGLTVAVILIPQVMAYSIIAGLPPVYGLYAALFGVAVSSMWGSSRHLSTGPVALVSFLTLTSLTVLAEPGSPEYIGLAVLLAFLVGLVQFFMGLFRLGFFISFISHAVVVGFSTAAAIIIASTQVPNLLGFSIGSHAHVYQNIFEIASKLTEIHWLTFFVGFGSLLGILALKKISNKIPAALIMMIIGTVATWYFKLDEKGLKIIGEISSDIPMPVIPGFSFTDISHLLPAAFVISIVGFLEAFAVAKSIASKTKQKVDVNQELVGQGLGNIVSSLFRGYPISGSFSRTAVNYDAGAKTGISSVFVSVFVLITIVFLTPLLYFLPKAILAAVVVVAVVALVNVKQIKRVYNLSKEDGVILGLVFITSFLLKPDDAIFIGVIVSLVLFIKIIMKPRVIEVGYQSGDDRLRILSHEGKPTRYKDLVMIRIDMSLVFVNAEHIINKIRKTIKESDKNAKKVLISFVGVNHVDATGIETLSEYVEEMQSNDIDVYFIYIKKFVKEKLYHDDLLKKVTLFSNIKQAKNIFSGGER